MSCLVDQSGSAPFRVTAQAFVSCDYIGGCPAALRFDLPPDELPVDFERINTDASKLGWTVQIRWEAGEPYRRDRCPNHVTSVVAAFPSKEEAEAATERLTFDGDGWVHANGPDGLALISMERHRQITELGHTRTQDLGYAGRREQDLIKAAAYYLAHGGVRAISPSAFRDDLSGTYPWGDDTSQVIDRDPIKNLTKAGALIAAEIDRQRATR